MLRQSGDRSEPDALRWQFALARAAVAAFGVPLLEAPGFEADDVIASVAHAAAQTEPGEHRRPF